MARKGKVEKPAEFDAWDVFVPRHFDDRMEHATLFYETAHPYSESGFVVVSFSRYAHDLNTCMRYLQVGVCPFRIESPNRIPIRLGSYLGFENANLQTLIHLRPVFVWVTALDARENTAEENKAGVLNQRLFARYKTPDGKEGTVSWVRTYPGPSQWFTTLDYTPSVIDPAQYSSVYAYNKAHECQTVSALLLIAPKNVDLFEGLPERQKEAAAYAKRMHEEEERAVAERNAAEAAKCTETSCVNTDS